MGSGNRYKIVLRVILVACLSQCWCHTPQPLSCLSQKVYADITRGKIWGRRSTLGKFREGQQASNFLVGSHVFACDAILCCLLLCYINHVFEKDLLAFSKRVVSWVIQVGLLTPLIFAQHRFSPLAAFTSSACFLHNGRQ